MNQTPFNCCQRITHLPSKTRKCPDSCIAEESIMRIGALIKKSGSSIRIIRQCDAFYRHGRSVFISILEHGPANACVSTLSGVCRRTAEDFSDRAKLKNSRKRGPPSFFLNDGSRSPIEPPVAYSANGPRLLRRHPCRRNISQSASIRRFRQVLFWIVLPN